MTKVRAALFLMLVISSLSGCQSEQKEFFETAKPEFAEQRLYSYMYWENGLPTTTAHRIPNKWITPQMVENPDLVIQTGFYNLRFDADDMTFTGFDLSKGGGYLNALKQEVKFTQSAKLNIAIVANGVTYTADSALIENVVVIDNKEKSRFNVRVIETGRYLQRFDHMGLVFKDADGNVLDAETYFEVSAWADRLVLMLDASKVADVEAATVSLITPNGTVHQSTRLTTDPNKAVLALKPHKNEKVATLDPALFVTKAYDANLNKEIPVAFDDVQQAITFDLTSSRVRYRNGRNNAYNEFDIEFNNPSDERINIPVVFDHTYDTANVTGTVMTLVEEDGRPTGHAVQLSKNWHTNGVVDLNHEGSWIRGSSIIPVEANSTKKLKLRVIYGYWDNVGAVSHSSLSLIGWGERNWQWDESALGTWGESMTFDPYKGIAGAIIADVRPQWTTPMNGTSLDHGWTENVGGGDFLVYYDENGAFRWGTKIKTAYRWTGPNMTEVLYSGVTDDDAIRFTYTTRSVRTNDYHRRFLKFDYEILKDIKPTRLAYFQMAADYYLVSDYDQYTVGDGSGDVESHVPTPGGNSYTGEKFNFTDKWIAIADTKGAGGDGSTTGYRGIMWMSSKVNGENADFFVHNYGRSWGSDKMVFDIAGEAVNQEYKAGTTISGEIEFIIPPKSSDKYWGYDDNFRARLNNYSTPWAAVKNEYSMNRMAITAQGGKVLNHYPITIIPNSGDVNVTFTIPQGKGVGHIPVIIKGAPEQQALYIEYKQGDVWVSALELEASIQKHSAYQGYRNDDGTVDYVFNVGRPVQNAPVTFRVVHRDTD